MRVKTLLVIQARMNVDPAFRRAVEANPAGTLARYWTLTAEERASLVAPPVVPRVSPQKRSPLVAGLPLLTERRGADRLRSGVGNGPSETAAANAVAPTSHVRQSCRYGNRQGACAYCDFGTSESPAKGGKMVGRATAASGVKSQGTSGGLCGHQDRASRCALCNPGEYQRPVKYRFPRGKR